MRLGEKLQNHGKFRKSFFSFFCKLISNIYHLGTKSVYEYILENESLQAPFTMVNAVGPMLQNLVSITSMFGKTIDTMNLDYILQTIVWMGFIVDIEMR